MQSSSDRSRLRAVQRAGALQVDVPTLIARARQGSGSSVGRLLELYQNYLAVLAAAQLHRRLARRVSPSDVVQETMLRAAANFAQFRGGAEAELTAWLRQILVNCLAKLVEQHLLAARRDLRREAPLDHFARAVEQSTVQLAALAPGRTPTPSAAAQRREDAVVLADRLAALPPDYRQVLVLRNLESLPFNLVAQQMNRSESAARMLWLRAIERLRAAYANDKSDEG